jgi:branched-chain amino acid transport system ATP-binding protein
MQPSGQLPAQTSRLQITDLHVQRSGKQVLHGVTLDVPAGAVTALLGANGAGKSSLVLSIAGLIGVAKGKVELDGESMLGRRVEIVRARGIASVLEQQSILSGLTVLDNIHAAGYPLTRRTLQMETTRVLDIFPELKPKLHAIAGTLSGGQMRMLAIAQALVGNPRFLLIDELSLGLAPIVVKRLAEVIANIAASGVGILLIEQFSQIALALAREVYVMERGRIVFSGEPAQLIRQPEILHSAYLQAS